MDDDKEKIKNSWHDLVQCKSEKHPSSVREIILYLFKREAAQDAIQPSVLGPSVL